MTRDWQTGVNTWFNFAMLGAEVQQVVWLRSWKLSRGDAAAKREATRLVTEKVLATSDAMLSLWAGKSPNEAIKVYRRVVHANRQRLIRSM